MGNGGLKLSKIYSEFISKKKIQNKINFENFLIFLHNRLIHPKNGNSEKWIFENWIFPKSGYFDFWKSGYIQIVDISKKWIFQKVDIFTVTVSGDLEIKNWFSNEPLLAVKK